MDKDDDCLVDHSGSKVDIIGTNILMIEEQDLELYNPDVEEQDIYIVSASSPLIVHNAPCFIAGTKVRIEENKLIRHLSSEGRAELPSTDSYALDSNNLGVYFSPTDQVNDDIFNHIGGQQLDNYIGDPQEANSDVYSGLGILNNSYWKKYTGDNNKATYLNELKQYDMSMFTMIDRFLPARANSTLGVVIEPHFLERSKARSRGKLTITGDTKPQNIAVNAKSFTQAKRATSIKAANPQVVQTGFVLQPQLISAKIKPIIPTATNNVVLQKISGIPQLTATNIKQGPASTVIPGTVVSPNGGSLFTLGNQSKLSTGKGLPVITQYNASSVPSHLSNQSTNSTNASIQVTKQSAGATYIFKSLFKSGSGAAQKFITVSTPDYISSASMQFISQYNLSTTRMTNVYYYKSAGGSAKHAALSASYGKPYEDGGSVNLFAFSRSLKLAEVSDYNLSNRKYKGTQITATDFNVNSSDGSGEPVVSFTIGDPNILINSDAGFGGNIKIE